MGLCLGHHGGARPVEAGSRERRDLYELRAEGVLVQPALTGNWKRLELLDPCVGQGNSPG